MAKMQQQSPSGGGGAAAAAKRKRQPGSGQEDARKPATSKRPKKDAEVVKKPPPKLLSKREQKDARREKKLALKKNYATIHESVLLWEELRQRTTTKEQKAALVAEILTKVKGNLPALANHHSGSRVIQWCLKDGGPRERAALLAEVKAAALPLAKSKYGHFVLQKLINVAPKEDVPELAKMFKGHVVELLRHPAGADVLDDLYNVAPTQLRNALASELYGREFALFGGLGLRGQDITCLGQLLARLPDAGKRAAVVTSLYRGLGPVLEKALLHTALAHRLLRDLLTEAPGSVVADVVDTLAATGGNALKLVHTHDGAAAGCMALAYGSPKDRKRLVKGMKGYVWQTAENEWGHAVVLTALSVTDDTALTSKAILGELKDKLEDLATHKHAHRVLMQLLCPDSHRYLPPAIYELLHPPTKTVMAPAAAGGGGGGALDGDDEELEEAAVAPGLSDGGDEGGGSQHGDGGSAGGSDADEQEQDDGGEGKGSLVAKQLGESKKEAAVRRRELLGAGPGALSGRLVALCAEQAPQLAMHPVGSEVLVEVARGAAGGLLWELQHEGVQAVHAALVQQVQQDLSSSSAGTKQQQQKKKQRQQQQGADDSGGEDSEPLLTHYYGSRAMRRLLLAGDSPGADGEGARAFAQALWTQALQGHCQQLVGSHAEKVLAGLLHCGVAAVEQAAGAELAPLVDGDVQAWAARLLGPRAGGDAGAQQQQQQQAAQGKASAAGKQQQQQQTAAQGKASAAGRQSKKQRGGV